MRIVTFNVNGIKSIHSKVKDGTKQGDCCFATNVLNCLIREKKPDILCLQEIRCQDDSILQNYRYTHPFIYTNHSTSKLGYSGTAILSKEEPLRVWKGFGQFEEIIPENLLANDMFFEGRLLTAEYRGYYVVCVYTPNSKDELARLQDRIRWDACFQDYLMRLRMTGKPTIACGDFNVAHQDKDIYDPRKHLRSAGFSKEERESFDAGLKRVQLLDSFRLKNPDLVRYTYWSNFYRAREHNKGWRIDYILISDYIREKIVASEVLNEYYGSDHCPVLAEISL